MHGSVRAAGQIRVVSVAAAVVVLLLLRLTRVAGQHEVLRESRSFTEMKNRNARFELRVTPARTGQSSDLCACTGTPENPAACQNAN